MAGVVLDVWCTYTYIQSPLLSMALDVGSVIIGQLCTFDRGGYLSLTDLFGVKPLTRQPQNLASRKITLSRVAKFVLIC